MIQQSELITLLVGVGVAIYVLLNFRRLSRIPRFSTLLIAYISLLAAWALTVLEGFFLGDLLNILEHASYAVSSVTTTLWCWFVFIKGEESQ